MNDIEYNARDLVSELNDWVDNLFSCKAAIFTGEVDGATADNALAVVCRGIQSIADRLDDILSELDKVKKIKGKMIVVDSEEFFNARCTAKDPESTALALHQKGRFTEYTKNVPTS